MNNQKMLDVVTMIANIILPDECDHGSALEIWLRAMKRKAREALESHESEAVGNAAAMREAVVALLDALDSLGCTEDTAAIAMMVPDIAESGEKCLGAIRKAKAALSAPPRNCDKTYRNKCDLIGRYVSETEPTIVSVEGFIDWFTAPAAERKGECDAQVVA